MKRIALIGGNSIGYVEALLSIWNSGNCALLLDESIPWFTLINLLIEADVHTCLIEEKIFDRISTDISGEIKFIPYKQINDTATILPGYLYNKFKANYTQNEAIVLYSSGTTGKSKGIILSHFAINTNADAIIDYMKPTHTDCMYVAKKFSHSSTLIGELLVALKTRTKLVIAPTTLLPRCISQNIREFGATILCLNPFLLSILYDDCNFVNLPSLKIIYTSGSILSDKFYRKAHAALPNVSIYNVYGLSEAGPRVSAQTAECCKNNSVGKPIVGVAVMIVNEKGIPVLTGNIGIIHVKTPCIFQKYITGENKHHSLYKDWFNTGDLGYIDNDGELHICGRVDDIIIINAHKIYPTEIETVISKVLGVEECLVSKCNSDGREALVCLYVGEEIANQNVVLSILSKLLMPYEIPQFFLKCDNLPRNENNKILRSEIHNLI